MTQSALFIGNESLLIQCATQWRDRGHSVSAILTRDPAIRDWAEAQGIRVAAQADTREPGDLEYDWLFSVANLSLVPDALLTRAAKGAINFHDGPLPRRAGLNTPAWAILQGDTQHGITWHLIEGDIDEGDILEQRLFDIAPDDTTLTLNTRAFEAAIESFGAVIGQVENGLNRQKQDLSQRGYHARADRPEAAARLDFHGSREAASRLIRGLDHGDYANPIALAKFEVEGRVIAVAHVEPAEGYGAPGTVTAACAQGATVMFADGALRVNGLTALDGAEFDPSSLQGKVLATSGDMSNLTQAMAAVVAGEGYWRKALKSLAAASVPLAISGNAADGKADWQSLPVEGSAGDLLAATAMLATTLSGGEAVDLALHDPAAPRAPGYLSDWVPLRAHADPEVTTDDLRQRMTASLERARQYPAFALDLPLRDPAIDTPQRPQIGVAAAGESPVPGTVISVAPESGHLHYDASRIDAASARLLAARLAHLTAAVGQGGRVGDVAPMPDAEHDQVVNGWNNTATNFPDICIHHAFEAQVARTPGAVALTVEDRSLTYAELNERANRAAHVLRGMGVKPGTLVGIYTGRTESLLIGTLAIMKAGGAYVPLDPAYPADRIALYIEDSGCPVIVTEAALSQNLPSHGAQLLVLDQDSRLPEAETGNPDSGVTTSDLAYLIYTSGSTGRPKGVMLEHRNVANFFTGMDDRIQHDPAGVWLAVTSLSFDISVLELFWTLARGFQVVLMGDAERALVSGGASVSDKKMDFSLFYWGNDDGIGREKYQLLLDGAKFADQHGFCAVWTPERHFHAFGGPYPNPSVTGAAVAAVTRNLEVRAGSCVAPLHHPIRIAEEWAVIDNLTNGRTGLAIASGWHPEDFVLRPENSPPENKPAMYKSIDILRRLWRGEKVAFPMAGGKMVDVLTQPRPVSDEINIWVTTAGNPQTWKEAGEMGAHVLTHLLGQSIEEVGDKIKIYHKALRDSGRDPSKYRVTLMLHSYLAKDRETAREVARQPMKDYLASAAALVKQYAWAFPAFKKPQGVNNPMQIDLGSLSDEENEAILDFAFHRYFEDSGLFGTIDELLPRVEQLKEIGVTEIAALIDYGIPREQVLEGLKPLAELLARANAGTAPAHDDFSIAAQIRRHDVSHLQCTPSMARMIAMNDDARAALARVRHLMIGGEALSGSLVSDLNQASHAGIENMYGPTETTIWSTTATADAAEPIASIGTPIANTQVYVLDEAMQPLPVGAPGELWIGGAGVARGYWQRDDLTDERFKPNPFHAGRMYRTGDLVRWKADGRLEFLGRADHQVKMRGYRIELGEIESVAEGFAGVRQAVVMAREDRPGDMRLVAYVTGDSWLATDALRDHLAHVLPAHMVPAHVVKLPEFPLTPNRKVDRKALPAPADATAPANQTYVAPEVGVQATIAQVWSRILNRPQIGVKDNFFALGGHSLLAVQAHREIKQALGGGVKLSITDIFQFPTLEALAGHLGEGDAANSATEPAAGPAGDAGTPEERAAARAKAMSDRRALRAGRRQGQAMTGLARVIAGLFPHGVGSAAVTIGAAPQPLRDELRAVENAVPHRRLEFAAGRAAARAAMRAAGLAEAAIPMDDDRAPIWPSGMVGSITHAEDVALAAVASLDVVAGLGLDAEPDAPLPDDVLSEICDGEECAWIAGQAQPLRWARLIFVAKEAAFKCQYPASKTIFGFDGMRIGIDVERGALTAAFRRAIPPFSEAEVLHGRFARSAGLVVAGFVRQHDQDISVIGEDMNRRVGLIGGLAALGLAGLGAAGLFIRRRNTGVPQPLPQMPADAFADAHAPLTPPQGSLRVFHLGHSLVGRDMPAMLAQLAPAGHAYASQLGWGATLRSHWLGPDEVPGFAEENAHPAHRPAREAIQGGDYDAVILTEMVELRDAIKWHGSGNYLAEWARFARQARPDARVYLYETWHRLDDKEGWLDRIAGDAGPLWQDELMRRAMGAEGVGPIYRLPGGPALAAVVRAAEAGELPGVDGREALFARTPDGSVDQIHLGDLGNYVIALTHYAVLYQRSPEGLPAQLGRADGSAAQAFDAENAARVQRIVWQVVASDPLTGIAS